MENFTVLINLSNGNQQTVITPAENANDAILRAWQVVETDIPSNTAHIEGISLKQEEMMVAI